MPKSESPQFNSVKEFKAWFESHITLGGKPYTLDLDQARAVFNDHKNTLITARAGSGKTRVIVAKVAYLVAQNLANLNEIAVFMFNRTAAAEVNERIGAVAINGIELRKLNQGKEIKVASTFHKFALDMVKIAGERPELISEREHDTIIRKSVRQILTESKRRVTPQEYENLLRLTSSFIARAGQKYSGENGLNQLCQDVNDYCGKYSSNSDYTEKIKIHRLALSAYEDYLLALNFPKIDFNILMARATRLLDRHNSQDNPAQRRIAPLKYILVDEYQDFSYLFFSIIQAVRSVCPQAHLFVVGDDWQAINRFAGSDVNYFIKFAEYFPEDVVNINLVTNYRSDKKIVENANRYMLRNYNPHAQKAIPFSKKSGKITYINHYKTKFDSTDLYEDALKDAKYQLALARVCEAKDPAKYKTAAQLLKTVYKIIKKHRKEQILLLHRHNFTSFAGITLENFLQALEILSVAENIMNAETFSSQVRGMTMHKSKGLESDVVIILECDKEMILSNHPHATIFEIFGDTLEAEKADQHRLLYVALTRAKHKLYVISKDKTPVTK